MIYQLRYQFNTLPAWNHAGTRYWVQQSFTTSSFQYCPSSWLHEVTPGARFWSSKFYHLSSSTPFQLLTLSGTSWVPDLEDGGFTTLPLQNSSILALHWVPDLEVQQRFAKCSHGREATNYRHRYHHFDRIQDDVGALYYVVAVILIYGCSILMMIASYIRKNKVCLQMHLINISLSSHYRVATNRQTIFFEPTN